MGVERADAPLPDIPTVASTFREVNGVELDVVAAGNPDDPLVVCLHGFPEFWYGWREYVEPLVEAGYRVLVPDQRGYNRSEKPDGIRPYRPAELTRDIVELIETEGRERAHVVGHDFGATVGWHLALREPERVERLAIVNVPHPTAFRRAVRSNLAQLRKSWYVFFFQLPRLPEWIGRRHDFQAWAEALRSEAAPGTFTDEEIEQYRRAWRREGAPTAMLNWYRAFARHGDEPPRQRVTAPTLIVWGERDRALVPQLAPASLAYCEDGRLERFPDASHWVNHERPERVTELLLDHLNS